MKAAVEAAANQTPSDEEMLAFEKSLLGQAFHLWACLKAEHLAEFPTPHVVYALMIDEAERHGQSKLTEIMLKVHVGSGGEARKKLRWPEPDGSGRRATDGHPVYGGWPAFYKFFADSYQWTIEEVNDLPIYAACVLLGAVDPTWQGLRLSVKDACRMGILQR